VDGVFHGPVPVGQGGDFGRVGLFGRQVGDGIDGLAGPSPPPPSTSVTSAPHLVLSSAAAADIPYLTSPASI
jgi:hypothetical protein